MKRPLAQRESRQHPSPNSVSLRIPKAYAERSVNLTFTTIANIKPKHLILTLDSDLDDSFGKLNADWARSSLVNAWFKYFPEATESGVRTDISISLPKLTGDLGVTIGKWGGNTNSPLQLLDKTVEISGVTTVSGQIQVFRRDYTLLEKANNG